MNIPSRARLASDDCEDLIRVLNTELVTIKDQLTDLTRSLSVSIDEPCAPPDRHSLTVHPHPPIYIPPRSRRDSDGWSICVSTDQPPTPLPRIARPNKNGSRKVSASTDVVPSPAATLRFLRVVDEREEERARARSRYLGLMRKHIENQLQQFMEREQLLTKRKERKEKKEKAARVKLKPSRIRSNGIDDRSYLENLYQSCLYKIIDVEQGMRKSGKLKTLSELKAFWEEMLTPLRSPAFKYQHHGQMPTASIWLDKELERMEEETNTNSWAITASKADMDINQTPETLCHSAIRTPTPLKFAPCKLPELKPIKEMLDVEKRLSLKPVGHYQGSITKQRALVHKVYQRAKANEIAMRSLLPHGLGIERPSFNICEDSSCLSAHPRPVLLPPLAHIPDHHAMQPNVTMPDPMTTLKHSIKNQDLELKCLESSSKIYGSMQGKALLHPLTVKVAVSNDSLLPSSHALSPSKPVCVPLTMSELLETSVTKEAVSRKRFMWNNYQVAGIGK